MIDLMAISINFDGSLDEPCSVLCDSIVNAEVEVISHFPGPLTCSEVAITVIPAKNAADSNKLSKTNGKKSVTEKSVETTGSEKPDGTNLSGKINSSSTDLIPIKEQLHLKQDGSLSSVALVCPSAHQLLG